MIDLSLLRIMKYKDAYLTIKNRIPRDALNSQTTALLDDFGKYFSRMTEHDVIDVPTFLTMFRAWHPKLDAEHLAKYEGILKRVREDVPDDAKGAIMHSLMELRLGNDLLKMVEAFEDGELPNIHAEIERVMEDFKRDADVKSMDFIRDSISDLLQEEVDDSGMRWRLDALNRSMRGLRPGDFGIVAGRPDKGKTTFISSETTFMAPALPEGKNVVWLNNEGHGRKIVPRLYQAALGLRMSELIQMDRQGNLQDAYSAYMGAEWRIRIFDIHGYDTYAVERIVEQHNPGLVVFDMIDNVRGFGDAARTDLGLERMYQWGRELAVKYDFAGIATSQISQEGDGMQFPTLPMLKDSKTGKQGACDFQIMIGASNDPGLQNVRYIGAPKNKLRREGGPSDPRATVKYEPEIARYTDIPMVSGEDADDTTDATE